MTEKLLVVGPWMYRLFIWPALDPLTGLTSSHEDEHKQQQWIDGSISTTTTTANTTSAIAEEIEPKPQSYGHNSSCISGKCSSSNTSTTITEVMSRPWKFGATMNESAKEMDHHDISESEWILLETLDCRKNRPLHTGPFLTVQRRRRRRKYVRTYLFKDPTLVDDLSTYQTNFVLDRINNWAFNAFTLDNVTGGRPLPNLCVHLFKSYGLIEHFNLDPVIVWKLFSIIEDGYHWRNPYHNAVHAADVTQAMHCFLQEKMILDHLTKLEIFCALLAAVTHDLDHPGVNQPFLIATSNHLAALYKNSSVLENHHWRSAMGCLMESGVSTVLGPELVQEVEDQIKSLVLATDITRQKEFLDRLTQYLDTDTLDMTQPEVRHFVLQIALKCADICNPCRPWEISRKWSMKVCEEFFRQGDYERQLNLPVTSLCDRYSTSVPKIQTGFFQFVVRPLFTLWHRMMSTPLSTDMMGNLDTNQEKWSKLLQADASHEARTEASNAEEAEIPEHVLDDSDTISIGVAKIAAKVARHEDRLAANSMRTRPAVRFDPHTTITAASDSEQSEEGEVTPDTALPIKPIGSPGRENDFLGIPRPDGRRHSIATGLMPIPPAQLLSATSLGAGPNLGASGGSGLAGCRSSSSLNVSEMVSSSNTRMVGRTVIRRESLPSGNLLAGRALPSKTILHLQKLSSKSGAGGSDAGGGSGMTSGELSPAESTTAIASTSSTVGASGETSSSPTTELPVSPAKIAEKSSCSSSTTDEILDFTFSLPEPGSRSSGSPRRSTLEATDLDELCPGTSILSMSPNVAHFTLQQSIDMEDQRRHLIRQQTCPVVSIHGEGGGKFDRPRFLSAAAAVSPTAVASSQIISQHRIKNRSPEAGGSGASSGGEEGAVGGISVGHGRGSGGSSSEAIMQCGVISEEADRGSGGSSAEASPLEIFVQQFPPGADDNDGEAPRRTSSSLNLVDSDQLMGECSNGNHLCTNFCEHSSTGTGGGLELCFNLEMDDCDDGSTPSKTRESRSDFVAKAHFHETRQSGKCYEVGEGSSPTCFNDDDDVGGGGCIAVTRDDGDEASYSTDTVSKDQLNRNVTDTANTSVMSRIQPSASSLVTVVTDAIKSHTSSTTITQDTGTQTEELSVEENSSLEMGLEDEDTNMTLPHLLPESLISAESGSVAATAGISHTATNTMSTSRGTSTGDASAALGGTSSSSSSGGNGGGSGSNSANMNRLATLLMWKNNRLWRSLTEEDHEENPCISDLDLEENLSPSNFYDRWNVRLTTTQQAHQGVVGARLQIRRGSAPTTTPALALACRGATDRRSDPTQYHSGYIHCFENNNPGDPVGGSAYAKHAQLRRGSFPVDLMKQTMLRPIPTSNKPQIPKTGRRGSLPTDKTESGEAPFEYKWMHVFPYSEDDSIISIKRRSSGGPELFAAAQQKFSSSVANARSWKAQILIEQMSSCSSTAASSSAYWPGRRRGSLPVDVYIASSGSCSSESESSAGDTSDT